MARRRRGSHGEAYFHVINRSIRKGPLFRRPNDYRAFLEVLRQGLERHPARLISYCVMSNHWHLVMGPVDPSRLSKLMHWVTVHDYLLDTGSPYAYTGSCGYEVLVFRARFFGFDAIKACSFRYLRTSAGNSRFATPAVVNL
jgi:hypothetical protein